MKIEVNNKKYNVIKDYGDTIKNVNLEDMITDYYDSFDYIVGDWAYGKLRLKGFYKESAKNVKIHNNIKNVEKYISEYCAYGCKYFILERIEN